ncbi:TonB-dependent receptor [Elongatibacter sediminis]|uniref:TonB-dependent receptor n=1 Tax=Elongatibacter sediminis TaxID=3119006 RepID=A0AAW9R8R0_9GAMM
MRNSVVQLCCLTLGCFSSSLLAINENSGASLIEEVLVTATKRGGQLIQDIPITIQAISGERLTEAGALDFNDYYRQIPGVSVNDQGPGDKRYVIRGINSTGSGTVGLYFDEIIVTGENLNTEGGRQPDIKLFDMDRIEVLKGPQGTTFGSSSLSGTIRWIPNYPDLTGFSADAGATFSSTNHASGLSWTVDGMVNIPLVADRLALRIAATKVDEEGYIDNRFRDGANNDDTEAVRAILALQATDDLMISFLAMHQDSLTRGRNGYMEQQIDLPASPSLNGGPVSDWFNTDLSDGRFDDSFDLFNLKAEYQASFGTFTATSSIFDRETEFDRDASAEIEIITGFTFPADGTGQSFIIQPQDRELFSNEIRFASDWDGPLQVLFGGFMQEEDRDFRSAVITVDSESGQITPNSLTLLDRLVSTEVDEVAVFGELTWQASDRLTLTGGFRWFDFDLTENATAVTGFPGRPGSGPGPELTSSESDTIFKFNLGYDFTDQILGYVLFSQGFRAGGTNDQTAASIAGVTIPAGFGSDSVDNYEFGIKSTLLDGRLIANAALYYMDWTDIQVRQQAEAPSGLRFTYRGNGGAAEVRGLEVELQAYPTDALQLGFTYGYTDAELTQNLPVQSDGLDGDKLEYVPKHTFSVNGRFERPLGSNGGLTGFVSGDLSWVDDQANRLRPTSIQYREIGAYSLANLRFGVEGESWSAIVGVNNLFDEDETTAYIFNGGSQPPVGFVPPAMVRPWPRTFYLSLRKSF